MVLGEVDYGLIGVVGGLTAFITFLNGIMAGGVGRFYAISVGFAQKDPKRGMEQCHEWFTTAVVIHTILPIALMLIGYPIGEWAIKQFLTIPPERIASCVWVWRFTCVSTFVGMASVPYHAMYAAKQEIAELTVYSFVTSTLNIFFLYYALTHSGDWLVRLSAWGCVLSVVPSLIIAIRSMTRYKECRFKMMYIGCWGRIKEMLSYSGWLFIGALGDILSGQGISIVINKFFGPAVNAAQNVANTARGQTTTLSGSMIGAFWPAIINAYGARQYDRMRELSYQVCKLAPIFMMIFAVPLIVEMREVLAIWLKNPPSYATGLCILALMVVIGDYSTYGFAIAMHAVGRIAVYQLVVGGVYLSALPLAFVFLKMGGSVYWTGVALIIARWSCAVARMMMARRSTGMSVWFWFRRIGMPLVLVFGLATLAGLLPSLFMAQSFLRVCVTTVLSEIVLVSLAWSALLTSDEKAFVSRKLKAVKDSFHWRSHEA